MSRMAKLPSEDQVRAAAQEIVEHARQNGHRPSVLAVARRFGLSNTTFRRNFPDLARELSGQRRTPSSPIDDSAVAARQQTLQERNAKLRRDNQVLHEHLDLAVGTLMRLTLENSHLRGELEAATKVTRITASHQAD